METQAGQGQAALAAMDGWWCDMFDVDYVADEHFHARQDTDWPFGPVVYSKDGKKSKTRGKFQPFTT